MRRVFTVPPVIATTPLYVYNYILNWDRLVGITKPNVSHETF